MKYLGTHTDIQNANTQTGVLLCNLGTPAEPTYRGLRQYLSQVLMDPRVIELPSFFRALLVKGLIINVRSFQSAATYRQIWTEEGSPLLVNSTRLAARLNHMLGNQYQVEVAMRYGEPSIAAKLAQLHQQGVRKLVIIPMYPQYSGSTNGATFDAIGKALSKQRWVPSLSFVSDYHHCDHYINAIAHSIKQHWQQHGRNEKLLMSFHGVPKKYITRGDPYQQQCEESARRIAAKLNLNDNEWVLVFQSRFGAEEWLQPYCDRTLQSLPAQGITSVDVVCPGFSVDCLETLEEIKIENRDYFLAAGGRKFSYIACLNDTEEHAKLMMKLLSNL